jgi:hypothetical protein
VVGILLALSAGWVPWKEAPWLVPWFLLLVVGYSASFVAPYGSFVQKSRTIFFFALLATMGYTCYKGGYFNSAEGLVDKAKALFSSQGGYTMSLGQQQVVRVTSVSGDGKTNLTAQFVPARGSAYPYSGTLYLDRDEEEGTCSGTVDEQGNGLNWHYQIKRQPCSDITNFSLLAVAKIAPQPEWAGDKIYVTLRKEG